MKTHLMHRLPKPRVLPFCLAILLSLDSYNAFSASAGWQRFVAPGTQVHGHQFGIVQSPGCQRLLWVTWSTSRDGLGAYLDASVDIQVDLDEQSWQLQPNLVSVNSDIPFLTIAVVTNIAAPDTLVDALASSTDAKVTILGPPAVLQLLDITEDSFDIAGLDVALQSAQYDCGVSFAI
jgi:hypothetical protein